MRARGTFFAGVLLALVSLAAIPVAAADWAASAPAPYAPKSAQAEAFRLASGSKSVLRIELGEADPEAIAAVRNANTVQFEKRLQIGIGRTALEQSGAHSGSLTWERVSGGVAARWEIASTGARALRIGLDVARFSPMAEIRFAGSGAMDTVYGPFTAADIAAMGPTYWSPVLEGERATVEVFVADGGSPEELSLAISRVSHLFVSPADANADALAKAAGSCEVDLICRSASDAALASVGKAVARMTFSDGSGGGTFLCTGTLLSTTAGPIAPYFYSANHCISTQLAASTLTTHWFYDRTGCGTGGTSPSYVQLAGGATLLYADENTDVLLLRLNQGPPSGAIYAGWDASTLSTGTAITAVHHPAGDLKKVSLATAGGFSAFGGGSGDNHVIALWNSIATGVTEGGSSGSGIFSAVGQPASDYRLRGGLHGGFSSCTATGAELRDYYSRFDRAYSFLSPYLNPGSSCTYTLSPASASVGASASAGSFNVTVGSGCPWTAISNASWLTTGSSGSGGGSISYSVAANAGAARTGTITVGGQAFAVSQQAGQGGSTNLVANGGFESGSSSWTQSASGGFPIIASDGAHSHSGSGYAWLGGYVSGSDSIYQDVTIPAGASQAALQFWYYMDSTETSPVARDILTVQVQNPSSGATLATVASYSNLSATSGWVQSLSFDLSAFAGQTVRLRFTATNDSADITNFFVDDVVLAFATFNLTDIWYQVGEDGWGLQINHQGNVLFGTLYTYDTDRSQLWLSASMFRQTDGSYLGDLYQVSGPAFHSMPWGAVERTIVGTMRITPASDGTVALAYSVGGAKVAKKISRFVYWTPPTACFFTTADRAGTLNVQDIWYTPGEDGWGVSLSQQGTIVFATVYTYNASGRPLWLLMSRGEKQAGSTLTFIGELYTTTGPPFNTSPWPNTVQTNKVGTMTLAFPRGDQGQMIYTVDGVRVEKNIQRFVVASPFSACQ